MSRATRAARSWWPLWTTWFVLTVVTAAPQWPGVFTIDSQAMYGSGLKGDVSDWYAPLHAAAWGSTGRLGLPIGIITIAGVGLFVAAVMAVISLRLPSGQTALASAVVVLWPPVLGLLSWVGRDVWFASWMLLTIWATFRAHEKARPYGYLAAAGVFGLLAADARQNGVPVFILFVAAAAVICSRDAGRTWAAVTVVLFAASFGWISLSLAQATIVRKDHHPEQFLYLHDLAELTVRTGRTTLPIEVFPSQDPATLDNVRGDTMLGDAVATGVLTPRIYEDQPGSDEVNRDLRSAWLSAIADTPGTYLRARSDLYARQLGLTGPSDIPFYGRSDEFDSSLSSSVRQRWPTISDAHTRVLLRLSESGIAKVAYAPALYLVAGLVASAVLAKIDRQRVLWTMVFGMQVFLQIGLFFTAPVVRFRYQYFQVVLGLTLVILAVQTWRARSERARGVDRADAARSPVSANRS